MKQRVLGPRVGGIMEIDRLLNKPKAAMTGAAFQWVSAGGGARVGAGKDGGAGRGLQKERSGRCSMAEKPLVL